MFEKIFKLKIEHGGQMRSSTESMISTLNSKVMRGEDHSTEWDIWRHRKTRWAIKAFPGIIKYYRGTDVGLQEFFQTYSYRLNKTRTAGTRKKCDRVLPLYSNKKRDYITKKKQKPAPCSTL